MSIEWILIIVVVALAVGNLVSAKPKPYEARLGDLRLLARKLGLHPKFANPDWLAPQKGLIQYTLIDDTWQLPKTELIAKDGVWQASTLHPLVGQAINLPSPIIPHVQGLLLKSNSISLYWFDENYAKSFGTQKDVEKLIEQDLATLKIQLTQIATDFSR